MSSNYTITDADILHTDQSPRYLLRIRDMQNDQKPREKLLAHGTPGLTMAELVAIILNVGRRREDVLAMSHRLLREYGEKAILQETNPRRLASALDIPIGKASQIIAALELGRRFFSSDPHGRPAYVRTAQQAYEYLKPLAQSQKEVLRGLYLNSRYQVIRDEIISVGSLTASIIHPREVFQPAIEFGAAAVIIAHNHPSGDVTPTEADDAVTQQLRAAGALLGIELLDHLIISSTKFYSILEASAL